MAAPRLTRAPAVFGGTWSVRRGGLMDLLLVVLAFIGLAMVVTSALFLLTVIVLTRTWEHTRRRRRRGR